MISTVCNSGGRLWGVTDAILLLAAQEVVLVTDGETRGAWEQLTCLEYVHDLLEIIVRKRLEQCIEFTIDSAKIEICPEPDVVGALQDVTDLELDIARQVREFHFGGRSEQLIIEIEHNE